MARHQAIYKITVLKWHDHNQTAKITYKKTLIANNLISDAKILALPLSHRWLFINLLLICGDYASDTVTMTERQLNDVLTARVGCENALTLLQQYQLVTFEKQPLIKERSKELKEVKKEYNKPGTQKPEFLESTQSAKAVAVVDVKNTIIRFSDTNKIEIKNELIKSWADTYDKDFLDLSFKEMRSWVLANPHKAPKSAWAKFMNGWFRRGWEQYRKTLKSEKAKLTVEDMNEILGIKND